MIRIYSLKLERELNNRERQQALNIITPERKAKALRFRRLMDQERGMATGVLELYALWKEFGISGQEEAVNCLCRGEQGKPCLAERPDAQYNISHSGAWIVCATGSVPLGIDVEQTSKYSERIIKRFFHPDETEKILSAPKEQQGDIFAEYWTMKESFMKLCGTGFAMPLSSFATERETGEIRILPSMQEELRQQLKMLGITEAKAPICQCMKLEPGYHCAVCTVERESIEYRQVTLEACMEELSLFNQSQPPSNRIICPVR